MNSLNLKLPEVQKNFVETRVYKKVKIISAIHKRSESINEILRIKKIGNNDIFYSTKSEIPNKLPE